MGSETFRKSERLQKILAYLVETSIRNEVPKGVTIILEVFGKGALNSLNSPTTIHANIYQLRKKLKEYYETEGQHDETVIGLANGEYSLTFNYNTNAVSESEEPTEKQHVVFPNPVTPLRTNQGAVYLKWVVGLLTAITITLAVLLIKNKNETAAASNIAVLQNPFWAELSLSATKPIHLIVGAQNTYRRHDSLFGETETVFSNQLTDETKQQRFLHTYEKDSVRSGGSVVRNPGTIRNLYDITLLLAPFDKRLNLTYSNIFTWDNVYNGDIIYIGGIAELYKLRNLFSNTRISINPLQNEEFLLKSVSMKDSIVLKRTVTEPLIEAYFFAQKLPTQDNNTIWVMSGTAGTRDKAVRLFTQSPFLAGLQQLLTKKFGYYPPYFEVVLKFKLYAKAGYDYEVIFMNELVRKDMSSTK